MNESINVQNVITTILQSTPTNTNMNWVKIYSRCDGCGKKHWFIRQREVTLPTGHTAKSHDLYCGKCYNSLISKLSKE